MARYLGTGLAALALAGCAAAPKTAQTVAVQPKKAELPYRWTHGHSDKGRQAALAAFGTISLAPGDFRWATSAPAEGETNIVVDLLTQTAFVYRADQLVGMTTISSGKKG